MPQKQRWEDVDFWVEDKLLYVELPSYRATALAEKIRVEIVKIARRLDEVHGERAAWMYTSINRASRMAYELEMHNRISAIDHLDEVMLYSLELCVETQWLFEVLNPTRATLLQTNREDILMADAAIKSMHEIMAA